MRFSEVEAIRVPNGNTHAIRYDGKVLWAPILARYVSLGDSIAAGHTINSDWAKNYGEGSQYGKNGNTETKIVAGCYTDLIRQDLMTMIGGKVNATSFARSGDRVDDLIAKLDHTVVRNAIAKADYVTVCIGANDVLEPAMSKLDEYINVGSLASAEAIIENNFAVLNDDNNANSYTALFNKLAAINPDAKYVFTTIYNPYKYIYIEEGHHGFFEPVLDTIPDMEMFGFDIDSLIKDSLLNTSIVQQLFNRVNGLSAWVEKYVTRLNNLLRNKINARSDNFILADTKAVYDPVPDRQISAPKHYNDLVNVEYTRGYDSAQMDWGRLWEGSNAGDFWWNLATKYVSLSGLDIEGLATELITQIVEKVIVPDLDPHPEEYGHHALKCSFEDALGWAALPRRTITFNANGGSGAMTTQTVVALDNMVAYANISANAFSPGSVGYYFTGWNTAAAGGGTGYSNGQFIGVAGNLSLYAQWSNLYTVVYRHSEDSDVHGDDDTGPQECYAFYINGVEQSDLSKFSNPSRTFSLPYGTKLKVVVQTKSGDGRSYVTLNGTKVAGNSSDASYEFDLIRNTDIHFEWSYWFSGLIAQSYWNCYITM